jgi:hypothetical protein
MLVLVHIAAFLAGALAVGCAIWSYITTNKLRGRLLESRAELYEARALIAMAAKAPREIRDSVQANLLLYMAHYGITASVDVVPTDTSKGVH